MQVGRLESFTALNSQLAAQLWLRPENVWGTFQGLHSAYVFVQTYEGVTQQRNAEAGV